MAWQILWGGGFFLARGIGWCIGVTICAIFILIVRRPIEGKCPYCDADIYSFNKDGFDCPRCNKRIIVKNKNELHKID